MRNFRINKWNFCIEWHESKEIKWKICLPENEARDVLWYLHDYKTAIHVGMKTKHWKELRCLHSTGEICSSLSENM